MKWLGGATDAAPTPVTPPAYAGSCPDVSCTGTRCLGHERDGVCATPGAACPKWEDSSGRCRTGDVAAMKIGTMPCRGTLAACVPGSAQ